NLLGSATEHEFKAGEAITIDGIIRPTDARFLRAVLAPGLRALSLSFGEPQLGAGLIQPGDHVDILLTQTLSEATGAAYRSVGETILSNVRVIAADQTHLQPPPDNPQHLQLATKKPVPHIVTLEVTPKQAEMLMVAQRLGSMQLTLRGLVDKGDSGVVPPPAWAAEVSPALGAAGDNGGGTQTAGGPNSGPVAVDIFRGTKSEQRCFSESTGMHVNCGKGASSPAKAAEPPSGNQPGDSQPAPKASRIAPVPAPAAHRA
ncbi:MAG TPA: Flp pilus assembly protein CpaB, partial [Stellaceae bacterium]|nr:Flp pilus assembly protein CpaB [Stellaceae bacterium]